MTIKLTTSSFFSLPGTHTCEGATREVTPIPHELVEMIFFHLETRDLQAASGACREWRNITFTLATRLLTQGFIRFLLSCEEVDQSITNQLMEDIAQHSKPPYSLDTLRSLRRKMVDALNILDLETLTKVERLYLTGSTSTHNFFQKKIFTWARTWKLFSSAVLDEEIEFMPRLDDEDDGVNLRLLVDDQVDFRLMLDDQVDSMPSLDGEVESRYEPESATSTIKALLDAGEFSFAVELLNGVENLSTRQILFASTDIFLTLVQKNKFAKASEIVNAITYMGPKYAATHLFVSSLLRVNSQESVAFAAATLENRKTDLFFQNNFSITVLFFLAANRFSDAIELIKNNSEDITSILEYILRHLADAGRTQEALRVAREMPEGNSKDCSLTSLALICAKNNKVEEALTVTNAISINSRCQSLDDVWNVLSETAKNYALDCKKELTKDLLDKLPVKYKMNCIESICKHFLKNRWCPDEACEYIYMIPMGDATENTQPRDSIFKTFAVTLARALRVKDGLKIASKIVEDRERELTLESVIKASFKFIGMDNFLPIVNEALTGKTRDYVLEYLAAICIDKNKFSEAVAFITAISNENTLNEVFIFFTQLLADRGNFKDAATLCNLIPESFYRVRLSETYAVALAAGENRFEEALTIATKKPSRETNSACAQIAKILFVEDKFEEALKFVDALSGSQRGHECHLLARFLVDKNRVEEAMQIISKITSESDKQQTLNFFTRSFVLHNQFPEAVACVNLMPNSDRKKLAREKFAVALALGENNLDDALKIASTRAGSKQNSDVCKKIALFFAKNCRFEDAIKFMQFIPIDNQITLCIQIFQWLLHKNMSEQASVFIRLIPEDVDIRSHLPN